MGQAPWNGETLISGVGSMEWGDSIESYNSNKRDNLKRCGSTEWHNSKERDNSMKKSDSMEQE